MTGGVAPPSASSSPPKNEASILARKDASTALKRLSKMEISTGDLPFNKFSIEEANARYEELARLAGIDPSMTQLTLEDIRDTRFHEEPGEYETKSNSNDRLTFEDEGSVSNQKLAKKERSIFQMIDVLSQRLKNLNAIAIERYSGCIADLNENSEQTSKQSAVALSSAIEEGKSKASSSHDTPRSKGKKGHCSGPHRRQDENAVDVSRLSLRHTSTTDAGRKLDAKLEAVLGTPTAGNSDPTHTRDNALKSKRALYKTKTTKDKGDRMVLERKLQSNLDRFITRAISELHYQVPSNDDTESSEDSSVYVGEAKMAAALGLENVKFPIPVSPTEMNPRLLLSYVCERMVLPCGTKLFKHFVLLSESQTVFVYMFWFAHCKFFQEDSQEQQAFLLQMVSSVYVKILGWQNLDEFRDAFFKYYPFLIASTIYWGFYYLCPGTRHLYSNAFKCVLYLECNRILTGVEITPVSILEIRAKIFPGEAGDSDVEYRPYIGTHGPSHSHRSSVPLGGIDPFKLEDTPVVSSGKPGVLSGLGKSSSSGDISAPGYRRSPLVHSGTTANLLSKTWRPQPLLGFTGDAKSLRFKATQPECVKGLRPRQQRQPFDASQVSPMLQQHLNINNSTAGRRSATIIRTVPVPWCETGGVDTFRKCPSRKNAQDAIFHAYEKAKREYTAQKRESCMSLQAQIKQVSPGYSCVLL
ncbi:unnamed protein product [Chrysoparadoxa australica]